MNILFEFDAILPVQAYGGTERVVYWLMKSLVQKGHRVWLLGNPKSEVKNIGVELIAKDLGQRDWRHQVPKEVELIHLHYTPPFKLDQAVLVTIHGNGRRGEVYHPNTVFVSKQHASNHNSTAFVHNGLDFSEYPFVRRSRGKSWENFLFLAKASWKVKNLHSCVQICKKNQKHLFVAGGRYWWPSRFIHSQGSVTQEEKALLAKKCDALCFPVRWQEPFGLAVVEAFAYGLPVLGSTYGSLSELITPQTGVTCLNESEFDSWLQKDQFLFDSQFIRNYAEENFSAEKMADGYVQFYQKVLRGEEINSSNVTWICEKNSEELLPF